MGTLVCCSDAGVGIFGGFGFLLFFSSSLKLPVFLFRFPDPIAGAYSLPLDFSLDLALLFLLLRIGLVDESDILPSP